MKEYKFKAVIKESKIGKGGAYIEFPYNVEKEFGIKGRVPVKCYFEKTEYRGSLVKMGTDCHIIGIKKDIRKQLNKEINDEVQVKIIKDTEIREVELHPLLKENLGTELSLKEKYDKLSYTNKKEMNKLLFDAKKEETLLRRLEKILIELKNK